MTKAKDMLKLTEDYTEIMYLPNSQVKRIFIYKDEVIKRLKKLGISVVNNEFGRQGSKGDQLVFHVEFDKPKPNIENRMLKMLKKASVIDMEYDEHAKKVTLTFKWKIEQGGLGSPEMMAYRNTPTQMKF